MNSILNECFKLFDLPLNEDIESKFKKYAEMLVETNKKFNLTAITEPDDIYIKHFADSISCQEFINPGSRVIDVGTGAGFPGVVLKIARPDIKLTLLDSLNKRLTFLDTVLNDIGLDSELVHSRAEEGGKNKLYREKFDIAVSRAVARLNVLCEYCLPYVKVGGLFVAMKGPNADEELDGAENALKLLGGKVEKVHKFNLPCDEGERTIIVIKKVKPTPKQYPRISGKIKSQPL